MQNKFYVLLYCTFFPFFLRAQDSLPDVLSLDYCINYALENNFEARQYDMQVQRADLVVRNAQSLYLPFVEARLKNNYNWGLFIDPSTNILTTQNTQIYVGGVEGEWVFFNGGYNYYTSRQSRELYQASLADKKAKNNEITLNIIAAYYQLLYAQEQLKIAEAQRLQTERQRRVIQGMVESGVLHKREMLQMESQLGLREVFIVDANNTILRSNLLLRQLMGISSPVSLQVDSSLSAAVPESLNLSSYDSVCATASSFLPEIAAARSRLEARRYGVRMIQASRYPSFSISGGVTTKSSSLIQQEQSKQFRQNLSEYVAFNLRVPVFNRFQTVNAVSLSRIDQLIQENEVRKVKMQTEQRVQAAYLDLIASHKKYLAVYKQMKSFEAQYLLAEKSYTGGVISSMDYSYVSNLYSNSVLQLLQAKYDFLYKRKVLDFYEGKSICVRP